METTGDRQKTDQLLSRDQLEVTLLHEAFAPGYLFDEVWPRIASDERFADLAHAALVHASRRDPGGEPAAIARYEGILEGVALAVSAIRQK